MTVKFVDNENGEIRTLRNVNYFTINESENKYVIEEYDGKMLIIICRNDYTLLGIEPNT